MKGEGNKEAVMNREILLLGLEEYLEESTEAGSFFGSSLDFKRVCRDVAVFFGFTFKVSPGKVHFREGEACVGVVELGEFLGEFVDFFARKLVEDILSQFSNFIADAVGAVERRIGMKDPARG
jgi:hypothetical protein